MPDLVVSRVVAETFQDAIVTFEIRGETVMGVLSYVCTQCAGYGDHAGSPCYRCSGDGRQKEAFSNLTAMCERIGPEEYRRVVSLLKEKL